MKPETNTGFDASITVAQDREAVVKTVKNYRQNFISHRSRNHKRFRWDVISPFRGCSWSGWYRVHIQGYQNDKAGFSKLESLYANNPQEMYRVFIRAMTKPASSDANIFKNFPGLSDVP